MSRAPGQDFNSKEWILESVTDLLRSEISQLTSTSMKSASSGRVPVVLGMFLQQTDLPS